MKNNRLNIPFINANKDKEYYSNCVEYFKFGVNSEYSRFIDVYLFGIKLKRYEKWI